MKEASIVITEDEHGTNVEMHGNVKDIARMLSLAVYEIHNSTNFPIKDITDDLHTGALAHKVLNSDNKEKDFADVIKDLLKK